MHLNYLFIGSRVEHLIAFMWEKFMISQQPQEAQLNCFIVWGRKFNLMYLV